MEKVIIIRYAEIHLKGKNRGYFERAFAANMEKSLKGIRHEIRRQSGRYLVEKFDDGEVDKIVKKLTKVFGMHSLSVGYQVNSDMDEIFAAACEVSDKFGSFKVETHRADKKFPLKSPQISAAIGGRLLDYNKNLKVDVHEPEFVINIDVRENGKTLVFNKFIKCADGMPVGTAGRGLLLLSGGIDSPVAGHMIAKRGMKVDCLHFHSYPYTNMQARQKVIDLAQILSEYTCGIRLSIISVKEIQEEIHKHCNGAYMVTILRRFMMRLAERLAKKDGDQCIITGESLGQVASQTIEGMTSSNSVIESLPVLRPLCGFDKNEIIERSRAMGAYDVSIRPYEDCCTVFLPDYPIIKPKLEDVIAEEAKLDIERLLDSAFATLEVKEY
ncbi:MAG TPA: tRNA 4-thiouridine(8) synthase ThiI [Candidatus Coproplasma excrementigallinarum]|uniref:Probable tRNA sulfurtransferase n=1 Tax=Candidatus Coproplasma excrementigallinarum TaxID=2840747 RepID=A0A9D1MJ48_9FIRM|nr:tRNA 4-thiouridine(8) synthase ThiI [Candidatus Coproplasma excrementigallinarum]